MSTAQAAAEFAAILASLQRFQIDTYLDVCSYSLLVYDYLLTFDREVQLIWRTKWNMTKILFVIVRYSVFADGAMVVYHQLGNDVSIGMCKAIYGVTGWMILWGIGFSELILIIRTWAIWGRDKRIAFGLLTAFLALWIVESYFLNSFLNSLQFKPAQSISPALRGCLPVAGSNVLFIDFLLLMVFETIVLVLTVFKMIYSLRGGSSPLIKSLYRDGILFYIFMFAISLVNVVVLLTTPHEFANLLSSLQRALHSILSARLLLNLREASLRATVLVDGGVVSSTGETEVSEMRYKIHSRVQRNVSTTLFSIDDGAWANGDDRANVQIPSSDPSAEIEMTPMRFGVVEPGDDVLR